MTDIFIFYTKGRQPQKIKANNHIEACEKFYQKNPDFHLSELKNIENVPAKKESKWLTHYKPHKKTEEHPGKTKS